MPIKFPMLFFFAEVEKGILKFKWNLKPPQIAKVILHKNKDKGFTIPDFKIYDKTIIFTTI